MDRFRGVVGYEDKYLIDYNGEVFSLINKQEQLMKKKRGIDKKGNAQVYLWNGRKFTYRKVSRLMAETFLKEKRSWVEIIHIDGNKLNCKLDNLKLNL